AARLFVVAAVAGALAAALGACGTSDGAADRGTGTVTVSAAASLTEAFGEIAEGFEAAHPGAEVVLNLGASSALATQVLEGAPADVYASADERNVERLVEAELVAGRPVAFARNALVIVTRPGNPEGIAGLVDLA